MAKNGKKNKTTALAESSASTSLALTPATKKAKGKKGEKAPDLNLRVDDYAIYTYQNKKKSGRVYGMTNTEVTLAVCSTMNKQGTETKYDTVTRENVNVCLGANPPSGRVYGCVIDPVQTEMSSELGDLTIYRRNTDRKTLKHLKAALATAKERFSKAGITGTLPFNINVRLKTGNMAGSLMYAKKIEHNDVVNLFLPELDFNEKDMSDYVTDVMYHEMGHSLMPHLFSAQLHLEWINLYNQHVEPVVAPLKKVNKALKDVTEVGTLTMAVKTFDDPDEVNLIKQCIADAKRVSKLSQKELDALMLSGQGINKFWPQGPVTVSTISSPLGEYSEKNYSEFFCEALRLHLGGKEMPKSVKPLMKKTLNYLAGRRRGEAADEE